MLAKIRQDIIDILVPRVKAQLPTHIQALFNDDIKYLLPHGQVRNLAALMVIQVSREERSLLIPMEVKVLTVVVHSL